MTIESESVRSVAGLMALAARTAPKAVGLDSIKVEIATGKEQPNSVRIMAMGAEIGMDFFRVNGDQVKKSDATVLIGVEGTKNLGLNCGGCGHVTCAEMAKAVKARKRGEKTVFSGPNCVFKISDLGIAVGSAVKTASIHNVDNRVMYTAGVAALDIGMLKGCSVAHGIPLRAAGKNMYFDVQFGEH